MREVIINSWEDLQKNISKIVVALEKDPNLKLAAASNPILALEELGYKIVDYSTDQLEDRIRFKKEDAAKLAELRNSIHALAGKKFDIRSTEDLNTVLFDDLKLILYDREGCPVACRIKTHRKGDGDDPLKMYTGLHPIIEPLLAFRQIDASAAGFSGRTIYQKIREGNYGAKSNVQIAIKFQKDKK